MKYSFSKRSLTNLEGVDPALVRVVKRALWFEVMDFSVVEGVRTLERQRELFKAGKSQTMNSKHLIQANGFGHAVDLYPYPIDMDKVNKGSVVETSRFGVLSGLMRAAAMLEGVNIISGIDWDNDGMTTDHTFFDAPHYELRV